MKTLVFLLICFLSFTRVYAQESFTVPEITPDQEKEILYNHVMAYFATGITFAKTNNVSAEEYGKYIGEQFKPFWNPDAGFAFFANQMMFMLKGVNSFSEMKIVEQNEKMLQFKMSNLNMLFNQGPMYGITYNEFLEASKGLISVLADYMKVSFDQKVDNQDWYVVTLKAK